MTITLSPRTEGLLRDRAERAGQRADLLADHLLADHLLADALAADPDDLTEDEVAEIRAGLRLGYQSALAGRERPVSAYVADVQTRQAGRGRKH